MDGSPYVISYLFPRWYGTLNWIFWLKVWGVWGINDTVLSIRASDILSEALPIYPIHLRNDMEHSISNVCLPLQHNTPFPMLMWCPTFVVLLEFGECLGAWITQCWAYGDQICCQNSSNPPYTYEKSYGVLRQQYTSLLTTYHTISCPDMLPNICYFVWKLRLVFSHKWHSVEHMRIGDAVKSFFSLPYTSTECYGVLKQHWMALLTSYNTISCTDVVP